MSDRQHLDGLWEFLPEQRSPEERDAGCLDIPSSGDEDTPIRLPGDWNTFPAAIGGDGGLRSLSIPAAPPERLACLTFSPGSREFRRSRTKRPRWTGSAELGMSKAAEDSSGTGQMRNTGQKGVLEVSRNLI